MGSWSSEKYDGFTLGENCGVHDYAFSCGEPIGFSKFFLGDDTMNLITTATIRYGNAKAAAVRKTFNETNRREMSKFFGMCLEMGLVKMPTLRDYCSSEVALDGHLTHCVPRAAHGAARLSASARPRFRPKPP
ncbi:unnamed protein product [Haemonchus placei]|uniref:DDE_Tnp_1_7 domain-containing protein n=1 Tax=Haemonchus placei TaxID=6290 RepID=A0A0N4WWG8_HAEPC|nr:unnamed protein product [Haemonchus placei]